MTAEILKMPALALIAGAFLIRLLPTSSRRWAFLAFSALALTSLLRLGTGFTLTIPFAAYELIPVKSDALSLLFGFIFALTAFIGGVYAFHLEDRGQQSAALLYAGSALGVTFAGDYFTLFVFWELMAVSATYLVWARKTADSRAAGMRYLVMHIFGGGMLFAGILLHFIETNSLAVESLKYEFSVSSTLMLAGVALNAAIPLLHPWLPDAYPKATITGAIFMSAFTTKSAVYLLIRVFPGWEVLAFVGVMMALYGVMYAVLVSDIRQILAYHIVSQVGYMVAGVGIGTEMALNGSAAHAFSHILYKALLFMGAGVVLHATGKSKLTELGGIAPKLKAALILYMIGAFSISGAPLFNGFISKSMVVSAAGAADYKTLSLLLVLVSVGTFLSVGLKLPYFTWFSEAKSEIKLKPVPRNMLVAMGMGAFLCTLFGLHPGLLYNYLPYQPVDYRPFTVYHMVEATQILTFTFVGFWLLRKKLEGAPKIALDVDWLYRGPGARAASGAVNLISALFGWVEERTERTTRAAVRAFENPMRWLNPTRHQHHAASYSPATGTVTGFVLLIFVVIGLFILI